MSNKRPLILLLFFTIITLIPLFAWLSERYDNNHFSCITHFTYHKDKIAMQVDTHYIFHGGAGVVEASGVLISADGTQTDISRKFAFNYIKQGNEYTLLSDNAMDSKSGFFSLRSIVPDFYMLSYRGVTLTIKKQAPNGYLFMSDNVPIYYCEKD